MFVWGLGEAGRLETLAASGVPDEIAGRFEVYPLGRGGLVSEAMTGRRLVAAESGEDYDALYPALAEDRRRIGAESLVALPLRTGRGDIIGAIFAAATRRRWVTSGRRALLLGIAEQTGVALDRASLQADAERVAEADAFLALVGESLERSTTASGRARRLVDALVDERATFAAVHLVTESDEVEEIASAGSLPEELADEDRALRWIGEVISTGRAAGADELDPSLYGGSGPSSVLVLPLRARGRILGVLTIRIAAGADWKPVISRSAAREIAARAALALDNALLYERERDVSRTRCSSGCWAVRYPPSSTSSSPLRTGRVGARSKSGATGTTLSALENGSIALVVGDVVGHGLEAAVAMGQLRGAVSALAQSASPPCCSSGSTRSSRPSLAPRPRRSPTSSSTRRPGAVRYACAGHPPPLVVSPDGRTRFLWDGRSAPLGSMLGTGARRGGRPPRRGRDASCSTRTASSSAAPRGIDDGLERLAAEAALACRPESRARGRALRRPARGRGAGRRRLRADALSIPVGDDVQPCVPRVARGARGLREQLARAGSTHRRRAGGVERGVVLAVSEAAANAVEHGYGCDGCRARHRDGARDGRPARVSCATRAAGASRANTRPWTRPPIIAGDRRRALDRAEDGATVVACARRPRDRRRHERRGAAARLRHRERSARRDGVVTVSGEIDLTNSDSLQGRIERTTSPTVVLDLSASPSSTARGSARSTAAGVASSRRNARSSSSLPRTRRRRGRSGSPDSIGSSSSRAWTWRAARTVTRPDEVSVGRRRGYPDGMSEAMQGDDRHSWASEYEGLAEDLRTGPAEALPELLDLVERMLGAASYGRALPEAGPAREADVVLERAREVVRRYEAGLPVGNDDAFQAAAELRDLYKALLERPEAEGGADLLVLEDDADAREV